MKSAAGVQVRLSPLSTYTKRPRNIPPAEEISPSLVFNARGGSNIARFEMFCEKPSPRGGVGKLGKMKRNTKIAKVTKDTKNGRERSSSH